MTVKWRADDWMADPFRKAVAHGLGKAAIVAQVEMRKGMGSEGGGVLRKAGKKKQKDGTFKKNSTGKGRNVYFSSPPGRYPGVRTGFLRSSIVWWQPRARATGKLAPFVRIGVPGGLANKEGTSISYYAKLLEDGSTYMPARPWAMRTIKEHKPKMLKAFSRGVANYMRAHP